MDTREVTPPPYRFTPLETAPVSPYLIALNKLGKPMYEGTVPYHVKQARRRKNKVAKQSRKVNR